MNKYSVKKLYAKLVDRNDENLREILKAITTGSKNAMNISVAFAGAFQADVASNILSGNLKEADRLLNLSRDDYNKKLEEGCADCGGKVDEHLQALIEVSDILSQAVSELKKGVSNGYADSIRQ